MRVPYAKVIIRSHNRQEEHDLEEPALMLPKAKRTIPCSRQLYNIIMAPNNECKFGVCFLIAIIVLWLWVVIGLVPLKLKQPAPVVLVVTYRRRVYHYNEDWPWVKAMERNV
jgi:hypothetical protein